MVVTLGKSGGNMEVSRIGSASPCVAVTLISTMAVLTTPNVTEGDSIIVKVTVKVAFPPCSSTVGCPEMMNGTVK